MGGIWASARVSYTFQGDKLAPVTCGAAGILLEPGGTSRRLHSILDGTRAMKLTEQELLAPTRVYNHGVLMEDFMYKGQWK